MEIECNELTILSDIRSDLEHHQDTADDAGVAVHHGLLHDVTDAAEVARLDGVLLAQQGPQGQAAGCQQVELVDAHGTHVMKQLVDHLRGGHGLLCDGRTCVRTRCNHRRVDFIFTRRACERFTAFRFTFGFLDDVADSEPLAQEMEGLVPGVEPLVHVVAGAGPHQVVQGVVAGS